CLSGLISRPQKASVATSNPARSRRRNLMSDQPNAPAGQSPPGALPKKVETPEKFFKSEKIEKLEIKEKPEKIEHKEKPEKFEHKEKPEKFEHKEKPE